jgi:hypothetical protein
MIDVFTPLLKGIGSTIFSKKLLEKILPENYQNHLRSNKHSESIASNTKSPTGGIFHQNSSTKI